MNSKAKRAALAAEFKAWLDAILPAASSRDVPGLTAEEEAKKKAYQDGLAALDAMIANEALSASLAPAFTPAPAAPAAAVPDAGAITGRTTAGAPNLATDPARGFTGPNALAEFAIAVRRAQKGNIDRRLIEGGLWVNGLQAAPSNYHQESGTTEGAMVPPAIASAIWTLVMSDPLMALLTIEPTEGNSVDLYGDETTPWGATGVLAAWRAEAAQLSPSKLVTNPKQVRLHELAAFVLATEELVEDAPRLNDRLTVKAPSAIRWKMIEAFVFGTGAGQPLGWSHANYAGKVALSRKTGAQVNPDDVVNMYARMLRQDGPDNTFWVGNPDILPDLILRSTIGNVPIWMPPTGLAAAPNGTLMGRPLFWSDHAQTKGTAGDLQYVNPDGYYAIQKGTTKFDVSIHLYFDYAITAFRWLVRVGGLPLLTAPVSPAKGSNTRSHFVVLT